MNDSGQVVVQLQGNPKPELSYKLKIDGFDRWMSVPDPKHKTYGDFVIIRKYLFSIRTHALIFFQTYWEYILQFHLQQTLTHAFEGKKISLKAWNTVDSYEVECQIGDPSGEKTMFSTLDFPGLAKDPKSSIAAACIAVAYLIATLLVAVLYACLERSRVKEALYP